MPRVTLGPLDCPPGVSGTRGIDLDLLDRQGAVGQQMSKELRGILTFAAAVGLVIFNRS
jgi:hypothetical protein